MHSRVMKVMKNLEYHHLHSQKSKLELCKKNLKRPDMGDNLYMSQYTYFK